MTLSPPALTPPPAVPQVRSDGTANAREDASAGKRAGAYLIDVAIVAMVGVLVWLFTGSLPLVAVAVIELWAIGWIWEGHSGATPGNLVCGIRTVRREGPLSVGAPRLLPRSLLVGLAHIIPILLPLGLTASGALDGVSRVRVIDVKKARESAGAHLGGAPSLDARVNGTVAVPGVLAASGPEQRLITRTPLAEPHTVSVQPPAPSATPAPAQAPVQEPYVPSGAATVPVFELSDGTVIRASGLGFIGRAPRAPESIPDAVLVRVPDGARSLSRTHASFGVEDDQLWVQDLGSANGAAVHHLGGSVTDLAPHTPCFLVPGDVLVLGGDAKLTFRRVVDRSQSAVPAQGAAPVQDALRADGAPRAQGAAPAPAPAPVAPLPSQAAATRASARQAAAAAPSSAPTAAQATPDAAPQPASVDVATVALQFQDGTTVPISGTGYIGRAPSLPEGERTDAALIAVPDGDRSVSRTHGRFGILQNQTWFEDLGSGNGSALRTGDGRSGPMTPHQRFTLVPGMVLQLGDCIIRVIAH
ncbi:FHA domain-containing protein [Microbacterium alcoholitolerans]|uniref:FHA domain-containing protein n=1 Tax=unclassified Microbacterium TaxID=2609290 RepID=UPI003D1747F7